MLKKNFVSIDFFLSRKKEDLPYSPAGKEHRLLHGVISISLWVRRWLLPVYPAYNTPVPIQVKSGL
jgi:hypothetical protein